MCEKFLVTPQTIRLWDRQNKVQTFRTPGNTRRFVIYEDIPDEEAPPTEEELALVAEKEAADKLKEIETKKARWLAIENKESLTARWLLTCLPHAMQKELESLQ